MGDPVHKTILLLDIERFGRRLHLEQAEAQRVLYTVLRKVLSSAGIEQTQARIEDRGDGVFVLIDATVPKVPVVRALLTELPTALYDYNRLASDSTQVRMRAVLHTGDAEITTDGVVGPPVVEAFRLVNAEELRDVLKGTTQPSVLCVSEVVYRDVVRHDHSGIRSEHFRPLMATAKEGDLHAWVHDPGNTSSATVSPASSAEPSAPAVHPTSGNFFSGTVTVQGDVVGGNKSVHGGTFR